MNKWWFNNPLLLGFVGHEDFNPSAFRGQKIKDLGGIENHGGRDQSGGAIDIGQPNGCFQKQRAPQNG